LFGVQRLRREYHPNAFSKRHKKTGCPDNLIGMNRGQRNNITYSGFAVQKVPEDNVKKEGTN